MQSVSSKPKNALGVRVKNRLKLEWRHFLRDWRLHLLILVPVIYLAIFEYGPMYGAQIAFRSYRARDGITGSEWVGLKWFERFLNSPDFAKLFKNTMYISLYSLVVNFFLAVGMALLLNTCRNERFKKVTQSIAYMPHFISTVVIVSIMNQVLSPVNGLYGAVYRLIEGAGYPKDIRGLASSFRHLYVWSGVWQNLGWDTIIYTAALASVSQDHHEAAMIDGASRWKRLVHIDLPTILPTACTMLILRCGSLVSVGFEKAYLMQGDLNLQTAEVISTFVYKTAMGGSGQFSYSSAVGLFNSVINCTILIFVNWLSKRLSDDDVGVF